MKKVAFVLSLIIGSISFKAQSPQYLNYQGVARNSSGTVINSGNIGLKFEILQGSSTGSPVYTEENSSAPSAAGVFTTAIGSGTNTSGVFSSINWSNGPFFIRVSVDPSGGTSFVATGTSQLLSVPYALYAEKAGNVNLNAGTGISITSGTIINTAPDQTVNISGPNVLGTYPNYTITGGSNYSGGIGILISGSVITNSAPDQTVTLTQSGISSITGTYPSYTIDVPAPTLSYNGTSQVLTLTQGTSVTNATLSVSSGSVSISGPNVIGTYPNYTITAPPATSITAGNSNITVLGSDPNFTVSSTPSLSLSGTQLSISNGNTVTLPTGTTYTNGAGISLVSGTIITNTAQDQTVTIANGTNVTVNGTYPNYTVNATPSLSLAANVLSISGGNSVALPVPPLPVITGQNAATVTTAGNNYTVNVPFVNMSYVPSSGVLSYSPATGTNTLAIAPTLAISGNVITSGPSSNSVTIPSYAAGAGLVLTGSSPNFTLGTTSTGTNTAWSTLGNTGTSAANNFIGTTDNISLNFRVNNTKSGKIDQTGPTFLGFNAGANNTSIYSTGIGFNVLNANTTGSLNTAMGYAALDANTVGTDNTAIGMSALGTNVSGNLNTGVGSNALGLNSTGISNTGIGAGALYNNANGSQNVAVGVSALYANTSGVSNSAFGTQALYNNTAAGNNVAIGTYALNSQSFGPGSWNSDNVAVGYQALYSNQPTSTTNGYQNTAVGSGALLNNTTGYQNTAIGYQSLFSNNVGAWNTAIGWTALYNNLSGNHNFAGANFAMYDNTSGSDNVAIGYTAMRYSKTGNANTVLGFEAGFGVTGNSYNNNTLIGKSAGYSLATGSGNVFLGNQAGYFETGSNKLYIANNSTNPPLVYGDFSTGHVGLGTTSPAYMLDIFSSTSSGLLNLKTTLANTQITMDDAAASDVYLTTTNGDFDIWTAGSRRLTVNTAGNVGIGTTAPGGPLHVKSSLAGDFIINENTSSSNPFGLEFIAPGQTWYLLQSPGTGPTGSLCFYDQTSSAIRMLFMPSTGNVGINTTSPSSLLHVNGAVTITDGSQGFGKVLTSNATGTGNWAFPLSPVKAGVSTGFFTMANSTAYTYSSSATLVITPAANGIVVFHVDIDYNFNISTASQAQIGIYVSASPAAPTTSTGFSASQNAGWASPPTGGGYGDIPVSFNHSMAVTAGSTYYIWVGGKGVNFNQTGASIAGPKVIATLHQANGL